MKKFLTIVGGIFCVFLIVGIIGLGITMTKGLALDKESKAYVDEVMPKILGDLKKEVALQYASDDLKKASKPEDLDAVFRFYGKLGKLKEYKGCKGQSHINITPITSHQISGVYEALADFENGPAKIQVTTIKTDAGWRIRAFRIDSMALAK